MTHLNLKEDISDLFHLGELIIELGVVSAGELLAHQLVRLERGENIYYRIFYGKIGTNLEN